MYKSKEREEWENSPRYAMLMRRGVSQETEEVLDGFLYWLEYDEELSKEHLAEIKALVDRYLWRNNPKVEQAERELLEKMKA